GGRKGTIKGSPIKIYAVDNLPPKAPQGILANISNSNHPIIKWNANIERDRQDYDVRKMNYFTGEYETIATITATSYEDFSETMITGPCVTNEGIIRYNVICNDINSNHSQPSGNVNVRIQLPDIFKNGQAAENVEITSYSLSPNYPNPFNPTTKIGYQIKSRGMTVLSVFDILGNEVAKLVNEVKEPGQYSAEFDASKLPSGTYIYLLKVNYFVQSHKMTLIK
ncbi:MAG: T9SS type A sorting domain-containing protein, partial [Syntrophothermus sp.]